MPKQTVCGTPPVVEINNPSEVVLFHRKDFPASLGDDTTNPPMQGQYRNILLVYEANNHAYLFNSDGIYTEISAMDGVSVTSIRLDNNHVIVDYSDGRSVDAGEINIPLYDTVGQHTDRAMTQKATSDALNTKVDKVTGKGLSTNDYTDADKTIVETNLNHSYITDMSVSSTAGMVSMTMPEQNPNTGETGNIVRNLPVASSESAGVMNSATFDAISENTRAIQAIQGGSIAVSGLAENPTQSEITAAWKTETGLTTLVNRAQVYDIDHNKVWTYYLNSDTWYATTNTTQVVVNQWTNASAGVVKGSTINGQIFAENDGTGSVNGWDTLVSTVNTKEPAIAAGTSSQYFRGDKTWQTLNKAAVGLSNVDNTSDATKKSDFTGAIANGNTGFVTGGAAYTALADKAQITVTSTDPGEGSTLAAGSFIAVYEA